MLITFTVFIVILNKTYSWLLCVYFV